MSRLKLMSSGPSSSTALDRLRPRARDRLALRAPAGKRRQAAQDKIGVGNRLPADLVEGILHRAGPVRRQQQALDVARRRVAWRGLLWKDIGRGAEPTAPGESCQDLTFRLASADAQGYRSAASGSAATVYRFMRQTA